MSYNLNYPGAQLDIAIARATKLPAISEGDASKSVKVKSDESGFEYVDEYSDTEIDNALDLKAPTTHQTPTGGMIVWPGAIADISSEWLICDGSAISRTTYSDLFAVIGTIHGSGDGSTTFNIPNLTDRFVLHADADSGGTHDVGDTGGSKTITEANMPEHDHDAGSLVTSSDGNHRHTYEGWDEYGNVGAGGQAPYYDDTKNTGYAGAHDHDVTGSTGSAGSGTDYLPKYIALPWIIKI